MDANLANFRGLFPEFDAPVATDVQVEYSIELAREQHRCSENAILYLSAHQIALWTSEGTGSEFSGENQGSGFASSQKVGDLQVTYTVPTNADDAYYARTSYGRQFLALKNAAGKKLSVRVIC
jgi:hypothetical protein